MIAVKKTQTLILIYEIPATSSKLALANLI